MSLFVLDTDLLSLWQHGHPILSARILACKPSDLAITVITVQEQLDGWHAQLNRGKDPQHTAALYQRLASTIRFLARVPILNFSEAAIARYEILRTLKLNIGKMDLRIAAIVLEHDAILVTRNGRDFARVAGLRFEDWSA